MTPEAAPRTPSGQELQALLRKVPTHSGAEYRNWIALLKKAEAEAAQPATPVGALDALFMEHRLCGPIFDGCYSHWAWAHCRADGMAWPCDVDTIRFYLAAASEPAGGGEG